MATPFSEKAASATPSVKVEDAIATAEKKLGGKFDADNFPAPTVEYLGLDLHSSIL